MGSGRRYARLSRFVLAAIVIALVAALALALVDHHGGRSAGRLDVAGHGNVPGAGSPASGGNAPPRLRAGGGGASAVQVVRQRSLK